MSEKETLEKSLQESIEEYEKKNKFANESILSIDSDRNKIFELQSDKELVGFPVVHGQPVDVQEIGRAHV